MPVFSVLITCYFGVTWQEKLCAPVNFACLHKLVPPLQKRSLELLLKICT
jgi:hypothetical protein|eukprot:COSAG01_NODE_3080_length_6628_cov_1.802420_7_plen_50_part_00